MRELAIIIKANNLYKAITGKPGKLASTAFTAAEIRRGEHKAVAERFIAKYADRLKGLPKSKRGKSTCNVVTAKSKTGKRKSKAKAARKSRTGKRK